eukprot:CAMPEP_0194223500 /NCGR_PEP_ID=MMETSP0156-20130528/35309_1 /TAXON_ID=33649 /ORGANISM="Thalassionema nitzschioides, Strain L26-B" /LENGTH=78 /DNA_ID=CAMNT_0038954679 /DNA_START=134 /DNA_END=370 /DNA_ORIENTATION=+
MVMHHLTDVTIFCVVEDDERDDDSSTLVMSSRWSSSTEATLDVCNDTEFPVFVATEEGFCDFGLRNVKPLIVNRAEAK